MAAGGIRLESHPLFSVCLEALRGLPATRGSRRGGDARRGGGQVLGLPKIHGSPLEFNKPVIDLAYFWQYNRNDRHIEESFPEYG